MSEIVSASADGLESAGEEEEDFQGGPWIPETSVAAATWALFVGLGMVMIGNGLNGSLLGVRSEAEGFGLGVSGVVMAGHFVGFPDRSEEEHRDSPGAHRGVMLGLAVVGSSMPLIALATPSDSSVATVAMFLLGGAMFPLYSLTLAYTNDWLRQEEILGASATLVRVNGTGAIVGPLAAAALMAAIGPRLFYWTLSGIFACIAGYVLYRIIAKDPLPMARQCHYVPFPARASAVAATLIPRRRRQKATTGHETAGG